MIARIWAALLAAAPIKIWALIGAAVAFTIVLAGFALIIWRGRWLSAHQALAVRLGQAQRWCVGKTHPPDG